MQFLNVLSRIHRAQGHSNLNQSNFLILKFDL